MGQFEQATGYHEQAKGIAQTIGYRQGESDYLCGLGLAYRSLDQIEKAIGYYEQTLEIAKDIGYRRGEAITV